MFFFSVNSFETLFNFCKNFLLLLVQIQESSPITAFRTDLHAHIITLKETPTQQNNRPNSSRRNKP